MPKLMRFGDIPFANVRIKVHGGVKRCSHCVDVSSVPL